MGHGRDYRDIAPLTDISNGPGTSSVLVSAEMTRLACPRPREWSFMDTSLRIKALGMFSRS